MAPSRRACRPTGQQHRRGKREPSSGAAPVRPRGTGGAEWRVSLFLGLRRERRDQWVILADLPRLGRAARRAEFLEEVDVDLVVVLPLLGHIVFVVDGLNRT